MSSAAAGTAVRVGFDIHTLGRMQTGNESYARNLARALDAAAPAGVEIVQYHTAPREALGAITGIVRRVRPHNPMIRVPISFPLALWRDGIDVAHFQYFAPPVSPCPYVLTVHDIGFEKFPEFFSPADRFRLTRLVPFSIRRAAAVIAVSESTRRDLVDLYGVPPATITVVHNGASPGFRRIDDRGLIDTTLRRLGVDQPYVLAVGSLTPRKNLERVVRAWAEVRRGAAADLRLVLAGPPGWGADRVTAAIRRTGLEPYVRVTGFVSDADLTVLYNGARCVVYASLYEGFGLPLLESMACGAPTVASDRASLPEIAGDAALLVDPTSHDSLVRAIRDVTSLPALRDTLVARGFERVKQFSWATAARQVLDVYTRVAARRAKRAEWR